MKKIILPLLLLPLLSGCNIDLSSSEGESTTTVSITHNVNIDGVFQDVTEDFTTNPKRVAFFSLGVLDILDYVGMEKTGITHIGMPTSSGVPEQLEKYKATATNIGTLHEPDPNALDLFMPDLIILDGRSRPAYSTLKTNYPLADVLDATNTTYNFELQKKHMESLGKIFTNVTTELEEAVDLLETKFASINEVSTNYEAAFVMSNEKSLSIYGKTGRYGSLFNEFGFQEAIKIENEGTHGQSIAVEFLVDLQPQIIFVMDRTVATSGDSGLADLLNGPLFKELEAVKNDLVFELDAKAWYLGTGGVNSTLQMVADLEAFVAKVTA